MSGISREQLRTKLTDLENEFKKAISQANTINGAILLTKEFLAQLETPDTPSHAESTGQAGEQ